MARKFLVESDEDEPEAAPAEDVPDPDEPEYEEGATNYHALARRLRTTATDEDALTRIATACDEVRGGIDPRDADAVAAASERGILDALFALIRERPPPIPGRRRAADGDGGGDENAAPEEDGGDDDAALTPAQLRARERLRARHARYDAIVLPAMRAIAHLVSVPGPLRREVAAAVFYTRALWELVNPSLDDDLDDDVDDDDVVVLDDTAKLTTSSSFNDTARPKTTTTSSSTARKGKGGIPPPPPPKHLPLPAPAVEAALRCLLYVAAGSSYAASVFAGNFAGADDVLGPTARWITHHMRDAKSDGVALKATRLLCAMARTSSDRALVFGGAAATPGREDDAFGVAVSRARHAESAVGIRRACVRLIALATSDAGEALERTLRGSCGAAFGGENGPEKASGGVGGGVGVGDDDSPLTALCHLMLGDHALDLRVDAARTLASLCREHVEIARELGERDVLDALRPLVPTLTDAAPTPPPEEGEEEEEEEAVDANDDESDVSVEGENILTDAFGVRGVGYISPPPKPRRATPRRADALAPAAPPPPPPPPPADADGDAAAAPPPPADGDGDAAAPPKLPTPPPRDGAAELFPVALELAAAIAENHPEARLNESRRCGWLLSYVAKVGKLPPADEDDLWTWTKACVMTLRDAAPAPEPEPEPEPEPAEGDEAAAEEEKAKDPDPDPDAPPPETDEEKAARLEKARERRAAQNALHLEDAKWHNDATRRAALGLLRALSIERPVRRLVVSTELSNHPAALTKIIAAVPSCFHTIEEGAAWIHRLCERGMDAADGGDALLKMGLIEKLKDVARAVANADAVAAASTTAAAAAHEAALMCFPPEDFLPELPPLPKIPTTPSPPKARWPGTWRDVMTRNEPTVLPLHAVVPEIWRFRVRADDGAWRNLEGDELSDALKAILDAALTPEALEQLTVEPPSLVEEETGTDVAFYEKGQERRGCRNLETKSVPAGDTLPLASTKTFPPPCAYAGLRFALLALGDPAYEEAFAPKPREGTEEGDAEGDAAAETLIEPEPRDAWGSDALKSALAPEGELARRLTEFVWAERPPVREAAPGAEEDPNAEDAEDASPPRPGIETAEDDRLAAIVAARVGLRRVYVKDAEAESEISAALVKWAYTTCRRAEEIVAERVELKGVRWS